MEQKEQKPLSPLAKAVITSFERKEEINHDRKIRVNPVIAKFAGWYEKLRRAMEYREDEVIIRATIERILRRKLLLGGSAKTTAEPLVRELIWARYLNDDEVPESIITIVEEAIDLHLQLRLKVMNTHRFPEGVMNEWTYDLMSSSLSAILNPNHEKETVANFMFQILREQVHINDDTSETKDAQVYIAVRKAFARDDLAFLRYHLFLQYFGQLTKDNLDQIVSEFPKGYKEIVFQLGYPLKEKIYSYIKKRTAAFLILEDVLKAEKGNIEQSVMDTEKLHTDVTTACETRYSSISAKVRTAIIRSVIFILFTKVAFAFLVEGTYERLFYGRILWTSILINTSIPPLLMIIVSLFIRTPDKQNTERIFSYIQYLLFSEKPQIGSSYTLEKKPDKSKPVMMTIFRILSLVAFVISFGGIIYILTKLEFNPVSQFIFIFFVTIVSFVSYRISLTANTYRLGDKQGLLTPLIDFFFMPVVRVGRRLTEGIAQINIFLFLFDFLIEMPFKLLFAFFEQWFLFLHAKSEEME